MSGEPPKIRVRRLDIAERGVAKWQVSVNGHTVTRAKSKEAAQKRGEEYAAKTASDRSAGLGA